MQDSIMSSPISYNINNIKTKFINNSYSNFRRANKLLTSSYVHNTPHSYYNEIINNMNNILNLANIDNLYTIGILYKDNQNKEYDSQYTITGSLKKFEIKNINERCNTNMCNTYSVNNFGRICTCVIMNGARREIEEEIGLSFDIDCKPIKIIENINRNKTWYSVILHISQVHKYTPKLIHRILPKNNELFNDINKYKIQVVIIGSEDEIKNKINTITEYRICHEQDIIGITLCKFTDLHFN